MIWKRPFSSLPNEPHKRKNLCFHLALGLLCLIFFLNLPGIYTQSSVSAQEPTTQPTMAPAQSIAPFQFQLPHPGYVTTNFSYYHPGIDLCTGLGMPIKPIAPGTVVEAGYTFFGLGLVVEVDHGSGYRSLYAHMGKIFVEKGKAVGVNDLLGEVGMTGHTTGPHTHLELTKDGSKIDPRPLLPVIRDYPKEEDFQAIQSSTPSAVLVPAFNATPSATLIQQPAVATSESVQKELKDLSEKEATPAALLTLKNPEEKVKQFIAIAPKPTATPKPKPKGGLYTVDLFKVLSVKKS